MHISCTSEKRESPGGPPRARFISKSGAEGGIRTHTPVKAADFKSAASTIPPPRLVNSGPAFSVVGRDRVVEPTAAQRASWVLDSVRGLGLTVFLGEDLCWHLGGRPASYRRPYSDLEATGGFEPPSRGFADLRLSPLGYVAPVSVRQACRVGAEGGI